MTKRIGYAHRGSSILILGLLLTGSACAPGFSAAGNPVNPQAVENAVHLNVTNHYNGPMEIYAVGSGTVHWMGRVLPGPVEFVARASDREPPVRSDRLLLAPGAVVDFEVATTLMNSIARVRP
jgi:hypothetical protein